MHIVNRLLEQWKCFWTSGKLYSGLPANYYTWPNSAGVRNKPLSLSFLILLERINIVEFRQAVDKQYGFGYSLYLLSAY